MNLAVKTVTSYIESLKLPSLMLDTNMNVIWQSEQFTELYNDNKEELIKKVSKQIPKSVVTGHNNSEFELSIDGKKETVKTFEVGSENILVTLLRIGSTRLGSTDSMKFHDVIMSNVRMGIIYEKLNVLAEYSSTIINYFDINTIFTTLMEFLTRRDKFGCQGVFIYYVDKKGKVKTWGSIKLMKEFTKSATKLEDPLVLSELLGKYRGGSKIILPIKTGNSINGLVGVILSKQEFEIAQGNPLIAEIYNKLYKSIIQLTNISIENAMARETLFLQSILDPLTGAYNRRYLETKMIEEINRATRYNRELSIILIDLNGFKKINDTYGHSEGDYLLKEIAAVINKSIRTIDTLARYGGDEFLLILPETSKKGAEKKAGMLKEMIAKKRFVLTNKKRVKITISAGITSINKDKNATPTTLLKEVDKSMYKDKLETKKKRK